MVFPRDLTSSHLYHQAQILRQDLFVGATPWLATDDISDELNQPRYWSEPSR